MFADLLATPGVHEHVVLASRVGFLALHGGLEPGTAEIARAAADRGGASCYAVVQPPGLDWHVPSHRIDPEASLALASVLAHCEVIVSIHGYHRRELRSAVLIGGGDRELAFVIATHLRVALPTYDVRDDVAAIPVELRGLDPRNPVNRGRGGGVQLELPHQVRDAGAHAAALVGALGAFATERAA